MTALSFTVTDAGRAEIINANNTGTGPVTITHIALGSGQYPPAKAQTSLQQEFKRLSVFGGEVVADDVIHVTITDDGPDQYTLGEFGLISDKGTLIALYAQTTPILEKNAEGIVLLSADMTLTSINANSITFGPAEFVYPPASLTRAGVVVLSNAINSTSQTQAATPQAVKTVNDALENHKAAGSAHTKAQVGLAQLENWSWSHSYTDATGGATKYASGKAVADAYNALNSSKLNAASYTAADVLAKLKTVDGAASGLDADLFDGVQRTDMEATLKAYTDTKVAGLVDAAPGTLDTLNELAAALGDDPNFATTMTNELAKKLNAASYTASDVLAKLKTVDGAASGLDADLLDGQHGSYYLAWGNFTGVPATATRWPSFAEVTGKPATYPPDSHAHTWTSITGKPSTFPPSSHSHSWSEITGKPAQAIRWPSWDEVTGIDGGVAADGLGWAVIGKISTPAGVKNLIKQWGVVTRATPAAGSAGQTFIFSAIGHVIPFPNACLGVDAILMPSGASGSEHNELKLGLESYNPTNFLLNAYRISGSGGVSGETVNIYFESIGY